MTQPRTTAEIVRYTINSFEGKLYTDDPVDTGGATKFGITQRTLQYYRRKVTGDAQLVVTKADVRNLTLPEAVACGMDVFAVERNIHKLADWRVQLAVYDYGFHSGQTVAIKALQRALHVVPADGIIGPYTLQVEKLTANPENVAMQVLTSRAEFIQAIMERDQTQRRFMLGDWKRTTQLQRLVLSE